MNISKLLANPTLPWTLIGMITVAFVLVSWINTNECISEGNRYYSSPESTHVAHHYYHRCGGATVGFSQFIEVDGDVVFQTYGGGKDNASSAWIGTNTLVIEYPNDLYNVREFKSLLGGVEIQLTQYGQPVSQEMLTEAQKYP